MSLTAFVISVLQKKRVPNRAKIVSVTSTSAVMTPNEPPNTLSYYHKLQPLNDDTIVACDKLTKKNFYVMKLVELEKSDEIDFKLAIHDIQTCNQLKHANILQYLYNFVHGSELYIITPLCSFTSADILSRPFGLPELAIAFIVRDTLFALDYIHHRGLIHRSVRGSHLLINSNGRCLLTGFKYSISCIGDGKRQPFIHQYPVKARPNINWFSPEILEQNLFGYNHKSDIYSLGITCCELANGVVPFSDLEPTEMLLDKLTGNMPRLLDQTCQELVDLKPNEMSPEDRDKYFVFRGRQFSNSFHTFTAGLCLNFDPQKRPDAARLLKNNFIKQLRRSPALSLLDFLNPQDQLVPCVRPVGTDATVSGVPTEPTEATSSKQQV